MQILPSGGFRSEREVRRQGREENQEGKVRAGRDERGGSEGRAAVCRAFSGWRWQCHSEGGTFLVEESPQAKI